MGFDTPVKRNGKAPVLLGEKMMTSGEYHRELSAKARMNVINMNGKNKKLILEEIEETCLTQMLP